MQSVSLYDVITLTPIKDGIELAANNLRLPIDNRNLAYRAAELFFENCGRLHKAAGGCERLPMEGIKIFIEKNIPMAAGLAGGSADAAAVLCGLNKLSNSPFSISRLMEIGAEIGSDVPFCLLGGNCTVKGRGEKVLANPLAIKRRYIIVMPEVEVSTRWAYETYDQIANYKLQITKECKNYLEPVVIRKYPVIRQIKDRLTRLGCGYAQMSGSGPSVFGEVKGKPQGERVLAEIKQKYPRGFLVESCEKGVEMEG